MYNYDVTSAFRQTTTTRGIPAMRPSYDGEHPSVPTPIYDELYSEYRRLFRALPGDRSGEEDLRFTGFAVRERPYGGVLDDYRGQRSAGQHSISQHGTSQPAVSQHGASQHGGEQYGTGLPQHQSFPTYVGQLPGVPQFVPAQQQSPQQLQPAAQHQSAHQQQAAAALQHAAQHQQAAAAQQQLQQSGGGQGWVATGYLAPVTVPAPAAPGRHRGNLLSLPPGRG
ncbi:hypothetical protein [Kitasatospora azatica]|uniref:hypothetical protein n=1 Tax=Kitasatospora azatica TaxID=58347 RepID=UPI00068D1279|nr:hypothetical protein [Kitasatospora azatica]